MRCCTVLQDPSTLYWGDPIGSEPLQVIAASYGHPKDPKLAFDVRPQLQARVVGGVLTTLHAIVGGGGRNILTTEMNDSLHSQLLEIS